VNIDRAIFSKLKAVRVGVVIRDELRRLEIALIEKIYAQLGAVEAKAKAFEIGLQFARDIEFCDIILKGDSLIVYRALSELSPLPPPLSMASIVHRLAHLLAKHASSIVDFTSWIEENHCLIE